MMQTTDKRCEAICVTSDGGGGKKRKGEQCNEPAYVASCGRFLCWCHHKAVSNPNRLKPLAFVEVPCATMVG